MPALTFNQLLTKNGLDPSDVRLARHKPSKQHYRALFDAGIKKDPAFQEYQDTQRDPAVIKQFRKAKHLAGFLVEPGTKHTIFVGVWDVLGEREPTATHVVFKTKLRDDFDLYRGRLVVDWGLLGGERAWVQRADKQDKVIAEIRRRIEEPAFPGFAQLQLQLDKVETIPFAWQQVLRNARGIYLLVHRESGQQYVGSAYGDGGFFARWKNYSDGHGGNVAMKELKAKAETFDACILEVVSSDATNDDVFAREVLWKTKLGTRVKGLNRN